MIFLVLCTFILHLVLADVAVEWSATSYAPIKLGADESLVLNFNPPEEQDVWHVNDLIAFQTCSASEEEGAKQLCAAGETPCVVPLTAYAGQNVYLISSKHCDSHGQKLQITVSAMNTTLLDEGCPSGDAAADQSPQSTTAFAPLPTVLYAHFAFMLVSFLLLLPAGSMIALTRDPKTSRWFKWHQLVQLIGALGALVGLGLGIGYSYQYTGSHLANRHQQLGVAACLFAWWQLVNGMLRPLDKKSWLRKLWLLDHRLSGLSALALGYANIVIGTVDFKNLLLTAGFTNLNFVGSWVLVGLSGSVVIVGILYRTYRVLRDSMKKDTGEQQVDRNEFVPLEEQEPPLEDNEEEKLVTDTRLPQTSPMQEQQYEEEQGQGPVPIERKSEQDFDQKDSLPMQPPPSPIRHMEEEVQQELQMPSKGESDPFLQPRTN